ncbi:MAG: peptide-N-glycosidase, partial [Bacteroidales bacterium]|nr:peptide-N-glycosidase [Bacteroidales bacterium]
MKQILPFVFFAVLMWGPFSVNAQSNVLHVVTHRRVTVTTDPSKGIHLYPAWGKFPDKNVSVRRIIMKVVLGCPDSLPCAHWDYLDPIYLRKAGGTSGKVYNYELSRMLTPYGSIFTKDWQWEWQADVTDFSALLRDSVEIVYQHSGYETTSVGWAVTIDFEITTGPEIVHPL